MATPISAPQGWIEDISNLRFPPRVDRRIQSLMDRNNEGQLTADEREDLAALVEMSERLALVRANALLHLEKRP